MGNEVGVRVFIEKVGLDESGKVIDRSIRRFDEVSDVSVNSSINSVGSASITLLNKDDWLFTKRRREKDISYQKQWLKKALSYREGSVRDINEGKVYDIDFVWSIQEFSLLNRVWIDFRVRDKYKDYVDSDDGWIPGFTGIVTSVVDNFEVGGVPTVRLSCKDLLRFFETTVVVVRKAVNELQFFVSGYEEYKPEAYFTTDALSGMAVIDYFRTLVEMVSISNSFVGFSNYFSKLGEKRKKDIQFGFEKNGLLDPFEVSSWYRREELWSSFTAGDKVKETNQRVGYIGRRGLREEDVLKSVLYDENSLVYKGLMNSGMVYIDPLLANDFNTVVLSTVFRSLLELFDSEKVSAWEKLKLLVDKMQLNFFQTPRGDLVLQIPRWNNLPGLVIDKGKKFIDCGWTKKDGEVRGEQESHSANYIVGDDSLVSWVVEENELELKTNVQVAFPPDYGLVVEGAEKLLQEGRAVSEEISPLRWGFRFFEKTSLPVSKFDKVLGAEGGEESRNAFAKALLDELNSRYKSGSVSLFVRPDLFVGRTLFLFERELLGYITEVKHRCVIGKSFTTELALFQLHYLEEVIDFPFEQFLNLFKFVVPSYAPEKRVPELISNICFDTGFEKRRGSLPSPFGKGYKTVVTQKYKIGEHNGIDLVRGDKRGEEGYAVKAFGRGRVTRVNWSTEENGNCIEINYGDCYEVIYLHLYAIKEVFLNKEFAEVVEGDVIGYVGNTGKSRGPHLHLEMREFKTGQRRYVNPIDWFAKGVLSYD